MHVSYFALLHEDISMKKQLKCKAWHIALILLCQQLETSALSMLL